MEQSTIEEKIDILRLYQDNEDKINFKKRLNDTSFSFFFDDESNSICFQVVMPNYNGIPSITAFNLAEDIEREYFPTNKRNVLIDDMVIYTFKITENNYDFLEKCKLHLKISVTEKNSNEIRYFESTKYVFDLFGEISKHFSSIRKLTKKLEMLREKYNPNTLGEPKLPVEESAKLFGLEGNLPIKEEDENLDQQNINI